MNRKTLDCRDAPDNQGCTMMFSGEEKDLVETGVAHAISVHGMKDSPDLREMIRGLLRPEFNLSSSDHRSFAHPDEVHDFKERGEFKVIHFEDGASIGVGSFKPGWKWSQDVQPLAGGESCQAPHLGYCVQGSMVIRMDDGKEFTIQKGDAFEIAPGHDAWVVGGEPCVLVDASGNRNYAKKVA